MRRFAYHACLCHLLALFASLHACLHVHTWVLLACVSSILQHNEAMHVRSKPTFVPRKHHLLFTFLPVCLFACLLAILLVAFLHICLHPSFYICDIYLACSLFILLLLSMHFPSIACLLVFLSLPLHVHTWSEDIWSYYTISWAQAKRPQMKACGRVKQPCSVGLGFSLSLWLCTLLNPFPSSSLSPLNGLY